MQTLDDYLIAQSCHASQALWKIASVPEKTIFVTDDNSATIGFMTLDAFPPYKSASKDALIGEICFKNPKTVPINNSYLHARSLIAEYPSIKVVPVVDEKGKAVSVLRKWQLFFKDEYYKAVRTSLPVGLPYPQYAAAIWRGAEIARATGADKISVLEFGVAEGKGLLACELISHEIASIFGIKIQIYGFDSTVGLPESLDYRDCPHCWNRGEFPMDISQLQKKLSVAKLIPGDFNSTIPQFIKTFSPAPIGVMLVDVDFYSSTLPVLKLLESDANNFLPIVNMYFDDIGASQEWMGETLAIREFNASHDKRKISPELESFGEYNFHGLRYGFSKLKSCFLYDHPLFTCEGFKKKIMHDYWR